MRDHLLFHVNGTEHVVAGGDAFASLADFLRGRGLIGTKVACAEGDCGACTVLVGRPEDGRLRYRAVDSCIHFTYQLDGTHIVTVEGLQPHPVQQAMIDGHGSQCGYCTPGVVTALAAVFESGARDFRTALTGNLCRCTGYVQILEAAQSIGDVTSLVERYPEYGHDSDAVEIVAGGRRVFLPVDIESAVAFREKHDDAVVVSGATDLSGGATILCLSNIPGLDDVTRDGDTLVTGARATWSRIEDFVENLVPEFHGILRRFGSPQIRNVATIAGNIAHASPVSDALPFLHVMGAEIESTAPRRMPIGQLALRPGEIITGVRTPLPAADETLRLYKVSRRRDLDIATFGAAILVRRDGDRIASARVAYAGVGPVVVRLPRTEAFLRDKPFEEDVFMEAGRLARGEVTPITDVRGSAAYRSQLAENILSKFFHDVAAA